METKVQTRKQALFFKSPVKFSTIWILKLLLTKQIVLTFDIIYQSYLSEVFVKY